MENERFYVGGVATAVNHAERQDGAGSHAYVLLTSNASNNKIDSCSHAPNIKYFKTPAGVYREYNCNSCETRSCVLRDTQASEEPKLQRKVAEIEGRCDGNFIHLFSTNSLSSELK